MDLTKKQLDSYDSVTQAILQEIELLTHPIAILSTTVAILNEFFDDINWIGFYLVDQGNLVVGPYQGKPAIPFIEYGKGVCGTALETKQTQLVSNVHQFCGHIACDIHSKSEIVVPLFKNHEVYAVLDIDAPIYDRFQQKDQTALELLLKKISKKI